MDGRQAARALIAAVLIVVLIALPIFVEQLRLLFAVAYCLLVPGIGWARRAPVTDLVDKIALAVMISLSATILVATALVATHRWSVPGALAILTALAVSGFVPLGRDSRGLVRPPAD